MDFIQLLSLCIFFRLKNGCTPYIYYFLIGNDIKNIFQKNDYQNILPVVLRALCHSLVKLPYKKTDNEQGKCHAK